MVTPNNGKANGRFAAGIVVLCAAFILVSAPSTWAAELARHVFLFIGDGQGPVQVEAGRAWVRFLGEEPVVDSFPVKGLSRTECAGGGVTDSAAAATAMACGVKTVNGMLGADPAGKLVDSLVVQASRAGWKTAVISTMGLDHATPAGFYAKGRRRNEYAAICADLAESGIDFLGGGAFNAGRIKDGGVESSVADLLKKRGYGLLQMAEGEVPRGRLPLWVSPAKHADGGSLPYAIERSEGAGLRRFVQSALASIPEGERFVMIVEGGRIDTACHAGDGGAMVREVRDFWGAVEEGLVCLKSRPDTVVVVTGDHETGGLEFTRGAGGIAVLQSQRVSGASFSKSYGARTGRTEEDAFAALEASFGLKRSGDGAMLLSESEQDEVRKSASLPAQLGGAGCRMLNARAGLLFRTGGHTGVDVPLFAAGTGSGRFAGTTDNTQVASILRELMGLAGAASQAGAEAP